MRIQAARRSAYEVFSRATKQAQRDRAARDAPASRVVDYLRRELAARTVDRLSVIKREFPVVVDLGAGAGYIEQAICAPEEEAARVVRARLRDSQFRLVEHSRELLQRDAAAEFNRQLRVVRENVDEELYRPAPDSVDAVLTSGSLHWVNDLPGVLVGVERMLKPDGLFLGNMVGGDSLFELRTSLQLAEMERLGRVSPRLSPLAGASDVGNLMQQAKFKLLTIDVEDIIVDYPDMFALLEDLRAMGESNAVKLRPATIRRDLLLAANAIYKEMHGNADGTVPATFRIVHMIGWKHAPDQPQPLRRGSGEVSFKEIEELAKRKH